MSDNPFDTNCGFDNRDLEPKCKTKNGKRFCSKSCWRAWMHELAWRYRVRYYERRNLTPPPMKFKITRRDPLYEAAWEYERALKNQ